MRKLYHGTTEDCAAALMANGWVPNAWSSGGSCGQRRYLYLTTDPENARWFANEKGGDAVLEVDVEEAELIVDPEDGVHDDVEGELSPSRNGPGNVCATRPLPPSAFAMLPPPGPAP